MTRARISQDRRPSLGLSLALLLDGVAHLSVFELNKLVLNIAVAVIFGEEFEREIMLVPADIESGGLRNELSRNEDGKCKRDLDDVGGALTVSV